MRHSTAQLLARAVGGDESAVAALLKHHAPALRRIVAMDLPKRWRSVLSEDDVLQQTFVDAVRDLPSFDPEADGSLPNWLASLARCNLRDAIRMLEANKRGGNHRRLHVGRNTDTAVALVELLAGTGTTPSHLAAVEEIRSSLDKAIQQLPQTYRQVVQLYDLEGLNVEKVAGTLDRSPGAVYMLRARAHAMLRELLGTTSDFFTDFA